VPEGANEIAAKKLFATLEQSILDAYESLLAENAI
jgi:hypothetical protein